MNKKNRLIRSITSLVMGFVMIFTLLQGMALSDIGEVKADSVFTFTGTNASAYNNQTIIEFNLVSIDGTNEQVVDLLDKARKLSGELTFIFKGKVKVIGKGVTDATGTYKGVFEDFYNLKYVNFTQATSLTVIEAQAFRNCDSLEYTKKNTDAGVCHLPVSLTYIGEAAFAGTKFTSYDIDESNDSFDTLDGVLYTEAHNTLVAFPPAKDGEYTVPDTVSTIYQYAFEESVITGISIPVSVTTIGKKAFYNSLLRVATFDQEAAISIGSGAFYQNPDDDRYAAVNSATEESCWGGLSQVMISESTYNNSTRYINNTDNTACFTSYVSADNSTKGYKYGCDIYVEPEIKISGLPITWAAYANVTFSWNANQYYTIQSLYLEKYGDVEFEAGTYTSDTETIKESGDYDLTVQYTNKNGNMQTKVITVSVDMIDSEAPENVTYTLIDNVCYLHSYDLDSGIDQIKYELNNNEIRSYNYTANTGFTLEEGKNTLVVYATDAVGNQSETKTYTITVPYEEKSITFNYTSKQLTKGKKFTLKTTFKPSTTVNKTLTFTSSDTSIAKVNSSGVVKGVNVGYAVITATSNSGLKAKCAVVVTKDPKTKKKLSLYKDKTYKLIISNLRDDYDYSFKSDDKSVAKVNSNGKITAVGIGECTITTKVDTGVRVYKLKTVVTVMKPQLSIVTKPSSIKVGARYNFKAYKKGISKAITWTSSNPSVATINKTTGSVIGQSSGYTVITAQVGDYKSSYTLRVTW